MAVCVEAAGWERGWELEAVGVGSFFSAVAGMAVAFAEDGCLEEEGEVDLGRATWARGLRAAANRALEGAAGRESWPAGRCGTAGAVLLRMGLSVAEDDG